MQNFSIFHDFVRVVQDAWSGFTNPHDPEIKDLTEFGIVVLAAVGIYSHLFPEPKPQHPIPRNISSFENAAKLEEEERFAQEQKKLVDRAAPQIQSITRTDSPYSDTTEQELEIITSSGAFRRIDSSGEIAESPVPNRGTPPGWVDVAKLL